MSIREIILLLLFCCLGFGGRGQEIFLKYVTIQEPNAHYGINGIAEMEDSSMFLIGGGYSNTQPNGFRNLLKLNKLGETQWVKSLTDSNYNRYIFNGVVSVSTNYLGFYSITPDTIITTPFGIVYFSKISYALADTSGNFVWAKTLSDSLPYRSEEYSIFRSNDGNVLSGIAFNDYFMLDTTAGAVVTKLDDNGNIIFRKKYELNIDAIHDTLFYFNKLTELSDGRLALCGQMSTFNSSTTGAVLILLDSVGNLLSCKIFDGSLGISSDVYWFGDKYILITTGYIPSTSTTESNIIELDTSLSIVKAAKLNRVGPTNLNINKIFGKNGRYIFASYPFFLMEIDTAMTTILSANTFGFGGTGGVGEKYQFADGGFCMAINYSLATLVIKIDSNLNTNCNQYDRRSLFTIGNFNTNYLMDLPVKTSSMNSSLTQFNLFTFSSSVSDTFYCRTATSKNELWFGNKCNFTYPNPAIDNLHFKSCEIGIANFRIYNTLGLILREGIFKNDEKIELPGNIKPGIYFIEIFNKSGLHHTQKFIKSN